jgi:hypothetical protein
MTLHELVLVIREHFEPLKRKFLAAQLGHRRRDAGNTTSYVAAALTLTLSLDRERDLKDREGKWTPRRNQRIHRLGE